MNLSVRRVASLALIVLLAGCERTGPLAPGQAPPVRIASSVPTPYPILFVTQAPLHTDFAARLSTFANHLSAAAKAPRGGALMLRYPDGSLRNLTQEAGIAEAVAVREPAVYWDGGKAIFSMLAGADGGFWQLYEVTGLGKGEKAHIARVARQPEGFNNLSPLYAGDDAILFTSDRPRTGEAHLYPQLDEYEATPTNTGIWRLDPASGALRLLNHAASGAFNPTLDSYGRIIFTRWDHLQQDQLAERDRDAERNGVALPFNSFNYDSEAADARKRRTRAELFPESRSGSRGKYGEVSAFTTNFFTAWAMNQDGSNEETLNHVGQHELSFGFMIPSFREDPALSAQTLDTLHANRVLVRRDGGLFHLREDPHAPGSYLAIAAREQDSFTTNQIVRLNGAAGMNPERMTVTQLTEAHPGDALRGGRYRNPLPLSDGRLIASHTKSVRAPEPGGTLDGLRLRWLEPDQASGLYRAGPALTPGLRSASGEELWEIEAVELRPRTRPAASSTVLEAPERAVLAEEGVSEAELRRWLVQRELALIVTRDQTSRDRAELQQPFNLRVPGGVETRAKAAPDAKVYEISHFQIFQGEQLRAYPDRAGRRVIAQPMAPQPNPDNAQGPAGSVRIAKDGSTAAFVPAGRALTWQTTDAQGNAVVRERNWVTFQPGEMRTCASCHGVNTRDQAQRLPPLNKPEALRELLTYWKTLPRQ